MRLCRLYPAIWNVRVNDRPHGVWENELQRRMSPALIEAERSSKRDRRRGRAPYCTRGALMRPTNASACCDVGVLATAAGAGDAAESAGTIVTNGIATQCF